MMTMTTTDEDVGLGCSLNCSRYLPSLHSQSFNFVKYKKCHVDKQYMQHPYSFQPDTYETELVHITSGPAHELHLDRHIYRIFFGIKDHDSLS
jgi:hypothetical protein